MVALLKGSPEIVEKVRGLAEESQVATTIITAYELIKGAYLSSERQDNLIDVKEALSNIRVLELSVEACQEASNIFYKLKKNGTIIGEFDILIAAIAKTNKEAILTYDKHFKSIEGLEVIEG